MDGSTRVTETVVDCTIVDVSISVSVKNSLTVVGIVTVVVVGTSLMIVSVQVSVAVSVTVFVIFGSHCDGEQCQRRFTEQLLLTKWKENL